MIGKTRLPDNTGVNPRFRVDNDTRQIYRTGMVIEFPKGGVFVDSISITPQSTPAQPWVRGADWIVDDTCVDDTAGSDARFTDPTFSQTLVRRIIVTTGRPVPDVISMSYQNFYDLLDWSIPGAGDPLEVSPDTISDLLSSTSRLIQQTSSVQSQTAVSNAQITVYPEDLHQTISTNLVPSESHVVNTSTGIALIRPKNGPFFRDSLVLTVNGKQLTPDVDYRVDTFDKNRTRKSRNTSGIYWAIMMLTPQAGEILVTYHTVGGQVTQDDFLLIMGQVKDLTSFINNIDAVTAESLPILPIIQSIFWRLDKQDTLMRRLLANPNPTNATAGVSVQKVFTAPDSKLHWYDIASLYKVIPSGPVTTADRFMGRIFFPGIKVALTFSVEANLSQGKTPIVFETQSMIADPGVSEDGVTDTATPVWPVLRAVWNDMASGILLQVGIANPNLTDNPIVEDLSTPESCWILDQSNPVLVGQAAPAAVAIHDSGFVLPDGVSKWIGDGTSKEVVHVPRLDSGYPLFVGKSAYLSALSATPWAQAGVYQLQGQPLKNFRTAVIQFATDAGDWQAVSIRLQYQPGSTAPERSSGYGDVQLTENTSARCRLDLALTDGTCTFTVAFPGPAIASADTLSIRGIRLYS